jgi:hypothetical protein
MYLVLSALLALALLATLRLSLPITLPLFERMPLRLLFHPGWLVTLILAANLSLGMYFSHALSPWPPAAFDLWHEPSGLWAGIAAFLAALTTDLWLLWTPAEVLRRYTAPERRATLRHAHLFNLVLGAAVIGFAVYRPF